MTSQRDREHIFERLRSGVVPERGLTAFAVGIERQRAEIGRLLDLAEHGEGVFKFLRGGYGCGKTFMARLALLDAQAKGFATSFVVVSDNDLHFHKFDDVYRKVVQELGTGSCPRGALGDVIGGSQRSRMR
jgi:predicted ATPase